MEPVTVTSRVRRTVRVAVALVVGQALLCALIGWLTLNQSGRADSGRDTVDQMAAPLMAPPRFAPEPTVAPSSASASASPSADRSASKQRERRTAPRAESPPAPPSPGLILLPPDQDAPPPDPGSPAPPPAPSPSASTAPGPVPPAPPALTPTAVATSVPPGLIREPVTIGDLCWPEGAFGRTEGGTLARCDAERHRRPRWKIV